MVMLDTNVVSELMRLQPTPSVVSWVDALPPESIWICAVTLAELRLGVALLPEGNRRAVLVERTELILERLVPLCAPFDALAANEYARVVAARRKAGRPISVQDAQIAAIALSTGLTLATRNVKDFEGIEGMKLIDPWLEA